MEPSRLLLIDGHNVIYRSFFAIRDLSTASCQPTNALFGFVKAVRVLRDAWRPTHGCVAFDGGLPRERLDRLESYKAQRPPMPDALRSQLPLVEEYLRAARIASARREGEEADDVIASLARRAAADGAEVLIASTDKDLCQLVGGGIALVAPAKSGGKTAAAEVVERLGVPPERVAEWLALTGDASDNIPGIPGVGPKTAARLLGEFGGLDGLWRRVEEVRPAGVRRALEEGRGVVERNLGIVRLKADLDAGIDWRACRWEGPDVPALRAFFERVEFRAMARELSEPDLL